MQKLRPIIVLLLVLAVLLSACSGNKLVISAAYNRIDNSSAKRFYKYAKFDASQKKQIKASIDQFHLWHRKQQLPLYVNLLSELETSLSTNDPLSEIKIDRWIKQVYSLSDNIELCNPMFQSAEFLSQLSDEQVVQIQARFDTLQQDGEKRRAKYDQEERQQRRLKSITKNLKFIGVRLNDPQKNMLAETLAETEPTYELWTIHWHQWKLDFITLLANRSQSDFEPNLKQLLKQLANIPETHYPEILAANQERFSRLSLEIGESLDERQQEELLLVMSKIKASLNEISLTTPEFDDSAAFPLAPGCNAA